ncbi:MAG: hypothetical protein AB1393_08865 [Candidatus Edwardsbacteria bacterium]
MTKVEELEREIKTLNHRELAILCEWFRRFDSIQWDRQIEKDIETGKLDKIAEKSITDHRSGRSKEL